MKLFIAASALLAMAAPAQAQSRPETREIPSTAAPMSQTQRVTTQEFLNKAWNLTNFEIQSARDAQSKASGSGYKDYAQMILTDHTKMDDELKAAVTKMRDAKLPTEFDKEHQQKLQQLGAASDQNFDHQFRAQQIQGHQEAIRLFRNYASNGDNAELKAWAKTSVAMLEKHLQRAEALPKTSGVM